MRDSFVVSRGIYSISVAISLKSMTLALLSPEVKSITVTPDSSIACLLLHEYERKTIERSKIREKLQAKTILHKGATAFLRDNKNIAIHLNCLFIYSITLKKNQE